MLKIRIFFYLFITLACSSFAQNNVADFYLIKNIDVATINKYDKPVLDSVMDIYHKTKNDSIKLSCLNFLSENLNDQELWVEYSKLLIIKTENKKTVFEIKLYANANNNIGLVEYNFGNTKKALAYFHKALKSDSLINNYSGLINTLNNIAYLYEKTGDVRSTEYYNLCLKIAEKTKDQVSIARVKSNLASIYFSLNEDSYGLKLSFEAIELRKKINDPAGLSTSYNNLGNYYHGKNKLDRAYFFYLKSIEIRKTINDKEGLASNLINIGSIYLAKKEFDRAKKNYLDALELGNEISNPAIIGYANDNLCALYMRTGDFEKAEICGLLTLEIGKKIASVEMIFRASEYLSQIYKRKKDFGKALSMLELSIQMQDSVTGQNIQQAVLKQQFKYDFEKKENAVKAEAKAEKEKILAVNKEEKRRQNSIIIAVCIGLLLAILLAAIIFRSLQQNRRKNHIISEQKKLVEEKNKEVLDSINYAKRIQTGILPDENEFKIIFPQSFILYMPKDIVSGDFYWFLSIVEPANNKNIAAVVAADCTGHGVPGAFMSMLNSTLLNQTAYNPIINTPADALNFLNKELPKNLKSFDKNTTIRDGMDLAFCLIDFNKGLLHYAGANNPCIIIRDREIIKLKPLKQAITAAAETDKKTFTDQTISIQKNDSIYLFTDGYADQFGGPQEKKFKYKRLEETLLANVDLPMQEQQAILQRKFENWKGKNEQIDDVLIIGVKL